MLSILDVLNLFCFPFLQRTVRGLSSHHADPYDTIGSKYGTISSKLLKLLSSKILFDVFSFRLFLTNSRI